jgi:hypothetical protein
MKAQFILYILLIPISSVSAWAGGRDGGGGVAFACRDGKVYLADTYALVTSDALKHLYSDAVTANEAEILRVIAETIAKSDPKLAARLKRNLVELKFEPVAELPLLNDDDIEQAPPDCRKTQLGIQYFASHTVQYNASEFQALSEPEKALFKLHEAYIRIFHANTHVVRDRVAREASLQLFLNLIRPSNTIMSDARSVTVATAFAGRRLECVATESSEQPILSNVNDLMPITVRVLNYGHGKTLISIETKNGQSFAVSGEFLAVEYARHGMIFQDGDDDWNQLALNLDLNDPSEWETVHGIFSLLRDDGGYQFAQPVACTLK